VIVWPAVSGKCCECSGSPDFHWGKQNSDSTWSEKCGSSHINVWLDSVSMVRDVKRRFCPRCNKREHGECAEFTSNVLHESGPGSSL